METTSVIPAENWRRACDCLRKKFGGLSEEDLVLIQGREETLLETIARKTGRSREAVIDAFSAAGLFRAADEPVPVEERR